MKLIYALLRLKPDTRQGVITAVSALNILVNVIIATVKIVIGAAAASIAIVSEGINNASDAATAVLTVVGVKLSSRRPTEKHPFGFGRIEYLTSLVIAGLIAFTGIELLISSAERIAKPAQLSMSGITVAILGVSAVVKYILGVYTIKTGKRVDSGSLVGVGSECRNDSFRSIITIASAAVYLLFDVSVDAYAGIIMAAFVIKIGVGILVPTLSDLLGRSGDKELAQRLYKEIRATEGVLNAADMMLHNYGPDAYSASVNIEIDHEETVGEVYGRLHELQLRIMHEYNVTMVFGIYAVDNKTEDSRKMRAEIAAFVRSHEQIKGYHALYHDKKQRRIYCDFVVDYSDFDWEELREDFAGYMRGLYPDDSVELTVETEFV